MAALQALVGGLKPASEDLEFLQQVGIVPTTSSSTTTTPYTSGGNSLSAETGTTDSGVLQAIQSLDEKVTNGFALLAAKMADKPVVGGGARLKSGDNTEMNSTVSAPMEDSAPAAAPSFFNGITGAFGKAANAAKGAMGMGSQPPPPEPTMSAATAGGANNSKKNRNNSNKRNNMGMNSMGMNSSSSNSTMKGGRRRRAKKATKKTTRKSRNRSRQSRRRN